MKAVAMLAAVVCGVSFVAGYSALAPEGQGLAGRAAAGEAARGERATPVTTALMFSGQAEAAMTLYTSLFAGSKVIAVERWAAGEEGGDEGTIKHAAFTVGGHTLRCMDNNRQHGFTFTPSLSLFVECADEAEIERLSAALSKDGDVYMPLDTYPFAKKFAWVEDRFGVSWQLLLAE